MSVQRMPSPGLAICIAVTSVLIMVSSGCRNTPIVEDWAIVGEPTQAVPSPGVRATGLADGALMAAIDTIVAMRPLAFQARRTWIADGLYERPPVAFEFDGLTRPVASVPPRLLRELRATGLFHGVARYNSEPGRSFLVLSPMDFVSREEAVCWVGLYQWSDAKTGASTVYRVVVGFDDGAWRPKEVWAEGNGDWFRVKGGTSGGR